MIDSAVRVALLTVSDRSACGERPDLTGPALAQQIETYGWQIFAAEICPDEIKSIQAQLLEWSDSGGVDLILTTGGTGFAARDLTPEATLGIIERSAPGLVEAIRGASLAITAHAMLSRAVAGIRGQTLIVNLPGNPKGALEALAIIQPALPHAVALLREDTRAESQHRKEN